MARILLDMVQLEKVYQEQRDSAEDALLRPLEKSS